MKKALRAISKLGIAAVLAAAAFPGAALAKEESGEIVIRLVKEWDDASNADGKRPDKVWLRVKFDAVDTKYGEPIDCVPVYGGDDLTAEGPDGVLGTDDDWTLVLSAENDWEVELVTTLVTVNRYTVEVRSIEVEELDVPDGYTSSVSKYLSDDLYGGTIVVTNTRASDEPSDPKDPSEPVEPKDPVGPQEPVEPPAPEGPAEPVTPDIPHAAQPPAERGAEPMRASTTDKGKGAQAASALPHTGDVAPLLALAALGLSALALGAGYAVRRR